MSLTPHILLIMHSSWSAIPWMPNWTGVLSFLAASKDFADSNSYLEILSATSLYPVSLYPLSNYKFLIKLRYSLLNHVFTNKEVIMKIHHFHYLEKFQQLSGYCVAKIKIVFLVFQVIEN